METNSMLRLSGVQYGSLDLGAVAPPGFALRALQGCRQAPAARGQAHRISAAARSQTQQNQWLNEQPLAGPASPPALPCWPIGPDHCLPGPLGQCTERTVAPTGQAHHVVTLQA